MSPNPDHPAQQVSWIDAALFCNWLSRREGRRPCYVRTGETRPALDTRNRVMMPTEIWGCDFLADGYRLPTEAEWEYACRAGTSTQYAFGDQEERLADYAFFSRFHAGPGGQKVPNAWGLFDMHGGVREWCWDWQGPMSTPDPATDPTGPDWSTERVHRGGSWYDLARACRSADRNRDNPLHRDNLLGFRVACTTDDAGAPGPGHTGGSP